MERDINLELDKEVFAEWKQRLLENGDEYFTEDGLLYNSLPPNEITTTWLKSSRRVLFLLKEQNQKDNGTGKWNEDIREWLTGGSKQCKKDIELNNSFLQYLAYLMWSFSKINAYDGWWLDEVVRHIDEVKKFFITQPFAIVECKKTPGGGKSDSKDIKYHLHVPTEKEPWGYGDLIQREIKTIGPNIIVCAGTEIYDFMVNHTDISDELEMIDSEKNFRYHQSSGTLIVYSEHPGSQNYKGYRYELSPQVYDGIFEKVRGFLQKGII